MAMKFTPQQSQAIELHGRNILVSAAAGSGKTAVLVERIVGMVASDVSPVDIDRLLVVTFTNAAAAEMKERIEIALSKRLETSPENVHLQKQLSLLHNAQITTIDSFCLFLIKNNFNDIGLDPGFRIADEGELTLLKQDVISELLEQQYQEKRSEFISCVEYFTGGSNDKLLEEYIERLYEFSMSYPWPEDWISQCRDDYKISNVTEMEDTPWCRFLVSYVRTILEECIADLYACVSLAERPDGPYMYGEVLEQETQMLEKLLAGESFSDFYRLFETLKFGRLPSKKDDTVNPLFRERVQEMRKSIRKRLDDLQKTYFAFSPEQAVDRMVKAAPFVDELLSLVLSYKQLTDQRKRRDNIIDFHDMEHFALEILLQKQPDGSVVPSLAAKEYRQHFKEILIDEYQDSNLVQELILKSISGEDEGNFNRFMVGDVKQSIYRFRLARPELFMEKYSCYSKIDSLCQRIDLHKNFRSRVQVLDSVNSLFAQIMGEKLGGVNYDGEAALYPGAVFPDLPAPEDGKSKERALEVNDSGDPYRTEYLVIGKDENSSFSVREQEAAAIAQKIRQLYAGLQVVDQESGKLRPVRYRDMVILLRTTSVWAQEFKSILEKEGIPAYVASRTGYFQAVEIKVLLQLLHVIDNPCQDIPLYGTMESFFGDFSKEEIAMIRARDRGVPLFELLCAYQGPLKEKVGHFLDWLSGYRKKTAYTPIHKLIQDILTDTGYLDYVSARPGGEQRRANVEMLLTRAASFEQTSYYGLFHFLRYIEQLERYEVDYGEADVMDENADVVRIMSIHKSKGLEFPVCFVAGLSKRFNMQDMSKRLIVDADFGIGADYIDSMIRTQSKTLKKCAVSLKMKLEALGEEMRVLYVAMTRAREKLILTAVTPDIEQFKESFTRQKEFQEKENKGKTAFSVLSGASCYLDFIFPCIGQVELISPEDLMFSDVKGAGEELHRKQTLMIGEGSQQVMTALTEKFGKAYQYQYLSGLYVKTTVSELKKRAMAVGNDNRRNRPDESIFGESGGHGDEAFTMQMFEEPEVVPYIPSFISDKDGISGTDRGSAYHKVMELLDLNAAEKNLTEEEVKRQLDQFVKEEKLTGTWRKSVAAAKIVTFLGSSLAKRMCKAGKLGKLHREQPFVIGLPASRLGSEYPAEEQVLIQGIIDVFFEEDGNIIVADYKTDVVKTGEELLARYQVQLDYYGEALERLTGKKVAEKILYSFALGKEFRA